MIWPWPRARTTSSITKTNGGKTPPGRRRGNQGGQRGGGSPPAGVIFDAASSEQSALHPTPFTWSHTCTGAKLLVVVFLQRSNLQQATAVSWGATTLARHVRLNGYSNNCPIELWYVVNPPDGTNSVSVTHGGTNNGIAGFAASYRNVDTASPFGTGVSNNAGLTGDSDDVTLTATVLPSDLLIGTYHWQSSGVITPTSGQNDRAVEPLLSFVAGAIADIQCTGVSQQMDWHSTVSNSWQGYALPVHKA